MLIDNVMAQADHTASQTLMPLDEALAYAERCRNEGKLIEAEALCRQILSSAARYIAEVLSSCLSTTPGAKTKN